MGDIHYLDEGCFPFVPPRYISAKKGTLFRLFRLFLS